MGDRIWIPGEKTAPTVKCSLKGCGKVARWRPELIFPDGECDRICAGRCKFNMYVCTGCKYKLEVKDFMSDYNWFKYQKLIKKNGKFPPKREDVRLDWIEDIQAGDLSERPKML